MASNWEFEEAGFAAEETGGDDYGKGKAYGKGEKGKGKGYGKAMAMKGKMAMMGKAMMGKDMWGGKGPWYNDAQMSEPGIPGLEEAIKECFAACSETSQAEATDHVIWTVYKKIDAAAKKLAEDDRVSQRGTPILARAIIEEYVEGVMGVLNGKDCYQEANLSGPLCLCAMYYLKDCRLFVRTLAPMVQRYTEDAVFRVKEEDRIQAVMWAAIEMSGLAANHHKKTLKCMNAAYDEAHWNAKYGSNTMTEPPELGFLQDFVAAFMNNFVHRAFDVLDNGVGSRDEQVIFVTALFQVLTHPEKACFPNDITNGIAPEMLPPANWPFIAEAATNVWAEMDMQAMKTQAKKQNQQSRWSGGKGGGKGQVQAQAQAFAIPGMEVLGQLMQAQAQAPAVAGAGW